MAPITQIEITGTVTHLDVITEGEAGGAVVLVLVEEDEHGSRLPAERIGRARLRFSPDSVEHLAGLFAVETDPVWLFAAAGRLVTWLDEQNGASAQEVATRLLKVGEEFGEAAAAYVGTTGQNPRKGITHTVRDVGDELADVVMAALVAIYSLGLNAPAVIAGRVDRLNERVAVARHAAADRVVA